jgi:hypothetical protein
MLHKSATKYFIHEETAREIGQQFDNSTVHNKIIHKITHQLM